MTIESPEIQTFLGTMQKSRALADAGVAVLSGESVHIVRRPTPGRSSTYLILAELTPQNVAWPEELWRANVLRQLAGVGVQLAGVATTGPLAGYSGMVGRTGSPVGRSEDHVSLLAGEAREMQEMNQSFNLQYLMLQQKMQTESRRFTALSNIMKTRHDTAKNAISNVR